MGEPREIELKLLVDGGDLRTLQSHDLLTAAEGHAEPLRSTYYDTPDRRLGAAGLSLRVRRAGDRFIQTVKSTLPGELYERGEWERAVAGDEVDRGLLDGTPAAALVADGAELAPVFTVEVERRTYRLDWHGTQVEVALDSGRIRHARGRRSSPISEVELELKAGDAAHLFSLARALAARVPLRLGVRNKSERGYALAAGEADAFSKAGPVHLSRVMSAGEAFQAIARACLRHMHLNEDVLLAGRDQDALHQLRVSLRRLRAAFSLFGEVLDDHEAPELRARLKALVEPLGHARNLDVLATQTLPAERARRPDETALLNLEKVAEAERTEAYRAVATLLRSEGWRTTILDLVAWIEAGPWLRAEGEAGAMRDVPARTFARDVLEGRRRKIKKRGRRLDRLDAHERHRIRIAAKKLRYGAEFFASLFEGRKSIRRHAAFVAALSDLQDVLGDLNDIVTGHEVLAAMALRSTGSSSADFAAGLVTGNEDGRTARLLRRARRRHDAFVEAEPFWR